MNPSRLGTTVVGFAGLSPEVISGWLYAGAGPGPLTAAAAAWDRVAAQWSSAAVSYEAVIAELTDGSWRGPAAESMAAAVQEHVTWMQSVAHSAEQTANGVRLAVAAYQQAFAAVVPPSAVAANRAMLASLVSSNTFGQNSALIAASQAQYEQMSAQDIAAMHDYAAASAAATTLPTFPPPPQTTNPTSASPGPLTQLAQSIVNNPTVQALNRFLGTVNAPVGVLANGTIEAQLEYMLAWPALTGAATANVSYAGSLGLIPAGLASSVPGGASGLTIAGLSNPAAGNLIGTGPGVSRLSAVLGRAMPVGQLSVPAAWAAAPVQLAAASLTAGPPSAPVVETAGSAGWLGGVPAVGGVLSAPSSTGSGGQLGSDHTVIPRLAREAVAKQDTRSGRPTGQHNSELADLRRTVAELTKDCELLERSADSLLKDAGVRPYNRAGPNRGQR